MANENQVPVGTSSRPDGSDVIRDYDLAGKSAVVTGGYSGIGLETVRALAGKGVKVLVPARNLDKARENLDGLEGDAVGSDDASARR